MSTNSDNVVGKLYELRATEPQAWLFSAETLWSAGGVIIKNTPRPGFQNIGGQRKELMVAELAVGAMLRGMAIECALKARSIQLNPDKHQFMVDGRFRMPKAWGRDSHDLCGIARSSGLKLSDEDSRLLVRLTVLIRFAARYPIPKSPEDMRQIPMPDGRLSDPRFFSQREIRLVTNFWWRITDRYPDEAPERGLGKE